MACQLLKNKRQSANIHGLDHASHARQTNTPSIKFMLYRSISVLVISLSTAVAQTTPPPVAPAPIEPPSITPAAPLAPPVAPPPAAVDSTLVVPAPIEPPVQAPVSPLVPPPAVPPVAGVPVPIDPNAVPGATLVAPPVPGVNGAATPAPTPNAARVHEFQGDDVALVLRTLARQAGLNVVVSPQIVGVISMRLTQKTPKEAMEIICQANGLFMDELNGVTYIKTQAEKAKEPTEPVEYTFSYATAEKAMELLQSQIKSGVPAKFDQRTNTVFLQEIKSNKDKLLLFLKAIDKPIKQVMIEARLVEINANPKQAYGINWAGVVGSSGRPQTIKYGGSPLDGTDPGENPDGSFSLNDFARDGELGPNFFNSLGSQFAVLTVPQMSATLRLLNEDGDAEFLANPRIVTANNQKATIAITRKQPVPNLNFNEQTAQAVFGGFEDKEFGNKLEVTPSVNKDDFVTLLVKPEISNKVGDETFAFGGAVVRSPIIDTRKFDSTVLIRSGDTLAIGGLLQDESSKGRTKVPVLGDVPLLGYFFQERINSRTKRNLLVFVTPNVLKPGYGTGLESQVSGLTHSGEEFADPNGWKNNARGHYRLIPTSTKQLPGDYPMPGTPSAPKQMYRASAGSRE